MVLEDTLPDEVEFLSFPDLEDVNGDPVNNPGVYDAGTHTATWNLGTVPAYPNGRGYVTVKVKVKDNAAVDSIITNTAEIGLTGDDGTLEYRYEDNTASAFTKVTQPVLPPDVGIGGMIGVSGGNPMVYWGSPTTLHL